MPREKPLPYVVREKKELAPKSKADQELFDALLAIVDGKIASNQKNLGKPKDTEAHRRRIDEAVKLALNSKNIDRDREPQRWKKFQSYLLSELGRRGGEQASAKRTADEELDHAIRADYVARQIQLHADTYGPDNGLDDTESEKEAKE